MKKGYNTVGATGSKKSTLSTADASNSSSTKRKEGTGCEVETAVASQQQQQQQVPSSILPKKGRYKDDREEPMPHKRYTNTDGTTTKSKSSSTVTAVVGSSNGFFAVPQQQQQQHTERQVQSQQMVQFTFGDLPSLMMNENEFVFFKATILIGKRTTLQQMLSEGNQLVNTMLGIHVSTNVLSSMFTDCGGGSSKGVSVSSTYVDHDQNRHHKLYLMAVPDTVSRSNHTWSAHSLTDAIKGAVGNSGSSCRIIFCGADVTVMMGSLTATVARAFSVYTRKTKKIPTPEVDAIVATTALSPTTIPRIHMSFMNVSDSGIKESIPTSNGDHLLSICESIQLTARLMDMPPEELTTTFYAEECQRIAASLPNTVTYTEIVGDDLDRLGYGGLYGIGKAATCPPRLVILEYIPDTCDEHIALVGKGIVYDTGGLSLKSKDGMPGMKYDMGGSAGVLGGFIAAVKMGLSKRIVLLLCLAENAIGPLAVRNDDILTLYSGKTVEVNNTDAEGRLVLADGVAHASKHCVGCTLIIDMATLTGAQLVAAGKTHAGLLANTIELEQRAVQAGLASGDLVVPLLYAPELLLKEFDSKVADMKNSVKDRSNAQASCAGHFIEAHLNDNYTGGWLHVDMAGPGDKDGRGTGYGVALILALLNAPGF